MDDLHWEFHAWLFPENDLTLYNNEGKFLGRLVIYPDSPARQIGRDIIAICKECIPNFALHLLLSD